MRSAPWAASPRHPHMRAAGGGILLLEHAAGANRGRLQANRQSARGYPAGLGQVHAMAEGAARRSDAEACAA